MRALAIWENSIQVGTWVVDDSGRHSFTYCPEWVTNEKARGLSLSLSLPLEGRAFEGKAVENWFENLLPDDPSQRVKLHHRFKTRDYSAFSILEAAGEDCAGAVQFFPEGKRPACRVPVKFLPLTEDEVAKRLREARAEGPLNLDPDEPGCRYVIAGAQPKIALFKEDGRWGVTKGETATTHILKLPIGEIGPQKTDFSHSVDNEWLCLQLAGEYLSLVPAARAEIVTFEDQRVLALERFDRVFFTKKRKLIRIPCEDLCQASGLSPLQKYEAEGGPGLPDLMHVFIDPELEALKRYEAWGAKPTELKGARRRLPYCARHLFEAQVLFYLLCATDGHAKNFSILHYPHWTGFKPAPYYDIVSAWPVVGNGPSQWRYPKLKLALSLKGKSRHYTIGWMQPRHFIATAVAGGIPAARAREWLEEMIEKTPGVVARVQDRLPAGFHERTAETIFTGIAQQAERLKKGDWG